MKTNLEEGIDFYYTPEGFMVLTEAYHRDRGYCCGNGCRHCPFHYSCVPEPRRSQLLQAQPLQPADTDSGRSAS